MSQYQFEKEWDESAEDVPAWALRGRKALNRVIRAFNDWQLALMPGHYKAGLLARIEWGRVQCGESGGEEWIKILDRMKEFVENN